MGILALTVIGILVLLLCWKFFAWLKFTIAIDNCLHYREIAQKYSSEQRKVLDQFVRKVWRFHSTKLFIARFPRMYAPYREAEDRAAKEGNIDQSDLKSVCSLVTHIMTSTNSLQRIQDTEARRHAKG